MSRLGICGAFAPWEPLEAPEGWVPCCMSSAMNGPQGCTCWEPIYDLEQIEPKVGVMPVLVDECDVRDRACSDCAYRPDSPERADETTAERLLELPAGAGAFFCHQGIRRTVEWRHPDGRTAPGHPADYQPPRVNEVPYKADGTPADLCAGWAARRT